MDACCGVDKCRVAGIVQSGELIAVAVSNAEIVDKSAAGERNSYTPEAVLELGHFCIVGSVTVSAGRIHTGSELVRCVCHGGIQSAGCLFFIFEKIHTVAVELDFNDVSVQSVIAVFFIIDKSCSIAGGRFGIGFYSDAFVIFAVIEWIGRLLLIGICFPEEVFCCVCID